jgi:hypothetical protein
MITYSITDLAGRKVRLERAACYANHYSRLKQFKECVVEVPVIHLQHQYDKAITFTEEDFVEYVRLLNVMGFKFSMKKENNVFLFTVNFIENKNIANKIILNAIRYLSEDYLPYVPYFFLKFAKGKMFGVNLWTRFMMAHYAHDNFSNNGHTICNGACLPKILTNAIFKEKILDNDAEMYASSVIPHGTKPIMGYNPNLPAVERHLNYTKDYKTLIKQDGLFKDIFKEYKAVCVRFM